MKILVTGATGFVVRSIVDQLVRAHVDVRAVTRNPTAANFPESVDVVQGDLPDPTSLVAALQDVDRMYLYPFEDTVREVVALAKQAGVQRIVDLSNALVIASLYATARWSSVS